MCRLNSCCCCASLRTGSLIIALLQLILGGGAFVYLFVMGYHWLDAIDELVSVLFGIILLISVLRRSTCGLKFYLVLMILRLIGYIVMLCFAVYIQTVTQDEHHSKSEEPFLRVEEDRREEAWELIAMPVIAFVIDIYLILVVYSYHGELKEEFV